MCSETIARYNKLLCRSHKALQLADPFAHVHMIVLVSVPEMTLLSGDPDRTQCQSCCSGAKERSQVLSGRLQMLATYVCSCRAPRDSFICGGLAVTVVSLKA